MRFQAVWHQALSWDYELSGRGPSPPSHLRLSVRGEPYAGPCAFGTVPLRSLVARRPYNLVFESGGAKLYIQIAWNCTSDTCLGVQTGTASSSSGQESPFVAALLDLEVAALLNLEVQAATRADETGEDSLVAVVRRMAGPEQAQQATHAASPHVVPPQPGHGDQSPNMACRCFEPVPSCDAEACAAALAVIHSSLSPKGPGAASAGAFGMGILQKFMPEVEHDAMNGVRHSPARPGYGPGWDGGDEPPSTTYSQTRGQLELPHAWDPVSEPLLVELYRLDWTNLSAGTAVTRPPHPTTSSAGECNDPVTHPPAYSPATRSVPPPHPATFGGRSHGPARGGPDGTPATCGAPPADSLTARGGSSRQTTESSEVSTETRGTTSTDESSSTSDEDTPRVPAPPSGAVPSRASASVAVQRYSTERDTAARPLGPSEAGKGARDERSGSGVLPGRDLSLAGDYGPSLAGGGRRYSAAEASGTEVASPAGTGLEADRGFGTRVSVGLVARGTLAPSAWGHGNPTTNEHMCVVSLHGVDTLARQNRGNGSAPRSIGALKVRLRQFGGPRPTVGMAVQCTAGGERGVLEAAVEGRVRGLPSLVRLVAADAATAQRAQRALQEQVSSLESAWQASKQREQELLARLATAQADVAHLRNLLHDASAPSDNHNHQLDSLPHAELLKKAHALVHKLGLERKKNEDVVGRLRVLHERAIQTAATDRQLADLQDAHVQQGRQLADAERRAEKCQRALTAVEGQQCLIRQLEASLAGQKTALAAAVAKAKAEGLRAEEAHAKAVAVEAQVQELEEEVGRLKRLNRYEEIEAVQRKAKADVEAARAHADSEIDSLRQQLRDDIQRVAKDADARVEAVRSQAASDVEAAQSKRLEEVREVRAARDAEVEQLRESWRQDIDSMRADKLKALDELEQKLKEQIDAVQRQKNADADGMKALHGAELDALKQQYTQQEEAGRAEVKVLQQEVEDARRSEESALDRCDKLDAQRQTALLRAERSEAAAVAARNELLASAKRTAKEIAVLKARLMEKDAQLLGSYGTVRSPEAADSTWNPRMDTFSHAGTFSPSRLRSPDARRPGTRTGRTLKFAPFDSGVFESDTAHRESPTWPERAPEGPFTMGSTGYFPQTRRDGSYWVGPDTQKLGPSQNPLSPIGPSFGEGRGSNGQQPPHQLQTQVQLAHEDATSAIHVGPRDPTGRSDPPPDVARRCEPQPLAQPAATRANNDAAREARYPPPSGVETGKSSQGGPRGPETAFAPFVLSEVPGTPGKAVSGPHSARQHVGDQGEIGGGGKEESVGYREGRARAVREHEEGGEYKGRKEDEEGGGFEGVVGEVGQDTESESGSGSDTDTEASSEGDTTDSGSSSSSEESEDGGDSETENWSPRDAGGKPSPSKKVGVVGGDNAEVQPPRGALRVNNGPGGTGEGDGKQRRWLI
eukprot:jgi/Botrbrau1/22436/Bobra.0091s0038.1